MKAEPIFKFEAITKTFGITTALDQVSVSIYPGEILGLIGENGSGKSTLTSIGAGIQKMDTGTMFFEGKTWAPVSMLDALNHGVGMIVQETGTIPGITVAENIFLGQTEPFMRHGFLQWAKMYQKADMLLRAVGILNIAGSQMTETLSLQQRKLVEVAKVMSKHPRLLIVDETTNALSYDGRELLYRCMRQMKESGGAVIFIGHDLEEVMEMCDRLVVLKDGQNITTFQKEEYDENLIKTSLIGRNMQGHFYRADKVCTYQEEIALEAENITVSGRLKNVSFQLHRGEILGIGGLSDCGMHELGKVLFGAIAPDEGTVMVNCSKVSNEKQAVLLKIGYLSKDRDRESLIVNAPILDNISITGFEKFRKHGLLVKSEEKKYVSDLVEKISIKCRNIKQDVSELSGGNKQKVVFAKWIGCESDILIMDCPTRGVDIGVKQAMYSLMYEMKCQGKSCVLITEELPELIGMSDRLLILKDGVLNKILERSKDLSESEVIQYML